MLIDSHCHLNFDKFAGDLPQVFQRAADAGVTRFINPSVDMLTSRDVVELAKRTPNLYAAIGFHPNDAATFQDDSIAELRALSEQDKVVSIGEIGLDYYWDKTPRPTQQRVFEQQLDLAKQVDLPVIIHQREAAEDTMTILSRWAAEPHPGLVLHSFSGDVSLMERAVALGFYLGISGPLTFKNARDLPDVVAAAPLDRLLVETDAPFLSPHPFRGKRNEPARVRLVAEKIAQIKNVPFEEISRQLTENTIKLFRLEV